MSPPHAEIARHSLPLLLKAKRSLKKRSLSHPQEVFMQATVSVLAEIPEELHESLKGFLDTHPAWDQDRLYAAALSLFLLQNGQKEGDRTVSRIYLDTLFDYAQ